MLQATEVIERLKTLNRPTAPWGVIDGRSEGVDLIAEWKIVDARWYEIFAKAGLAKVFRIYLKLDDATKEVRAQDREYEVSWVAGVPKLSIAPARSRVKRSRSSSAPHTASPRTSPLDSSTDIASKPARLKSPFRKRSRLAAGYTRVLRLESFERMLLLRFAPRLRPG